MNENKSLMSRREAGEYLGISVDSVDRLVAIGELTAVRIGRAVRIASSSVARLATQGAPTVSSHLNVAQVDQ